MNHRLSQRLFSNLELLKNSELSQLTPLSSDVETLNETLTKINTDDWHLLEFIINKAEEYRVPVDTLLRCDLSVLNPSEILKIFKSTIKHEAALSEFGVVRIPFISIVFGSHLMAQADPLALPAMELPRRLFPQFNLRSYTAFEVEGDSMLPEVPSGSAVIGELVEDISEIQDGKRYIVSCSEGIFFKRIFLSEDFDISGNLILKSDNQNGSYPDKTVNINSDAKFWVAYKILVNV